MAIFQGRLLSVMPARLRETKKKEAGDGDGVSGYKRDKEEKMKEKSEKEEFHWNSLFLRADAVADATAEKYGVEKGEFLDPTEQGSMAVKMALAETQLISQTKVFFESGLEGRGGGRDGMCVYFAIVFTSILPTETL